VDNKANANLPDFFPKLTWDPNDFCPPDPNTGYLKLYGEDAQGRCKLFVNDNVSNYAVPDTKRGWIMYNSIKHVHL
jgi:hypothetical protein